MTGRSRRAVEADSVRAIDSVVHGPHGPIPVRRYSPPPGSVPQGVTPIIWVHGGAFVFGDLDLPESHEVALALAGAGYTVITVDYRLASIPGPRWPGRASAPSRGVHFPVPCDDVVAVVRATQADFGDGVILGGASAGACLAAAATLRLAEDDGPVVRGIFLAYGLFHASLPRRSAELRGRLRGRRKYTHLPPLLNLVNLNYTRNRAALAHPHAFPGGHPLPGFPAALLIDAESDSMRASGEQFARELETAGRSVEYHVLADSHAFLNRPHTPAFAEGIRLIIAWAGRLPGVTTPQ